MGEERLETANGDKFTPHLEISYWDERDGLPAFKTENLPGNNVLETIPVRLSDDSVEYFYEFVPPKNLLTDASGWCCRMDNGYLVEEWDILNHAEMTMIHIALAKYIEEKLQNNQKISNDEFDNTVFEIVTRIQSAGKKR